MTSFLHPSGWYIGLAVLLFFLPRKQGRLLLPVAAIGAIVSVLIVKFGVYGKVPYLNQILVFGRVDSLALVFAHVFAIQALIGFIYAWHVKEKSHHIAASLYVAGGFGCVFAGDYFTLFIFWELMSVASTFLVWVARNKKSTQAGFRYFIFHTLGGLFLLAGLLLRYRYVGNMTFTSILPDNAAYYDYLILIGFCVNAAVIPFHAWLPDTYPEATIPGAVFMSAFTTKTAVYVLLRGFSGFEILTIAGTVMALYGVFYATIENNARKILSYHIISQVGYMVAGCGIGTALTLDGASAHAYAHIVYKGLLFMTTGAILYAAGTAKLSNLGGLIEKLPWVFVAYMFAAVSISGFPLFSGFVSKTMVINGAANAHRTWIAMGLELASVGTFLSVGLKLPYFAFYAKPKYTGPDLKPIPVNMYIAMFMASFLCLFIGVYPEFLYSLLPNNAEYVPYSAWHVVQTLQILLFTGLGFYLLVKKLTPEAMINLDLEYFYRLIGRLFVKLCRIPFALFDDWWTERYRAIGIRGLSFSASFASWGDNAVIKATVDFIASTVRSIGGGAARIQSGQLRYYIALAFIVSFALVLSITLSL